jgi:hypothetical protein
MRHYTRKNGTSAERTHTPSLYDCAVKALTFRLGFHHRVSYGGEDSSLIESVGGICGSLKCILHSPSCCSRFFQALRLNANEVKKRLNKTGEMKF